MNIAFFGSSLVSAYWNGAATYFRGVIKELHRRGHHVTFYEPDAFDRQKHRDLEEPAFARSVVYQADAGALAKVLEEAAAADVVIKASGVGVFDEELEVSVARLRGPRARFFWDVDAPATLLRMEQNAADRFRRCVPEYDGILTYGGGDAVVERYRALGARSCVPIYNALDPETHFPVEVRQEFAVSLAFAGNRLPDREERVREFFFKAAEAAPEETFLLAGSGWEENAPELPNVRRWGHLYTRDHNAFNRSAKAVLNVCRESMAVMGFSPPTRVFEVAGSGACLITDAWRGVDQFLAPGEECLVARDGQEVAALLRQLTPEMSAEIGARARQRLLNEHTYAHRADALERILAEATQMPGAVMISTATV